MTQPLDSWTTDEWTIHSLNIHGLMFERWCEEQVRAARGWRVTATQSPVAYPPVHPLTAGHQQRESTLDIRADSGGTSGATAIIECKKANPEFVRWLLFPVSPVPPLALPAIDRTPTGRPAGRLFRTKAFLGKITTRLPIADQPGKLGVHIRV